MFFLLGLILSFNNEYQNFINSPRSESIFVNLVRDRANLNKYKDDPVILWFWRSRTNDTSVDSFLKEISIPRNFYLSGVIRWEAAEAKNLLEKYTKLNFAIHFDSVSIENFLSLVSLGFSLRRLDFLKSAFSLPILSDFRNQIFLLGNFSLLFLLTLFFTIIVFILTKLVYYLPILSHRFDPMKHNIFKGIIGFALLLIPIFVLRNFYLALIVYSIILTFILSNREKNWLRINLILLIISAVVIAIFNFAPFLKGKDKAYHLYQMVAFDSDIRINPESNTEKEILAYTLKKQAFYDEAMALYEDLYYNHNIQNVAILNNLANLYAIYDEDEQAEKLYNKAIYSNRGEPYFNLALLKFKKIEYLTAGQLMEEAKQKGFVSVSKEPVDILPDTKKFYNILITKDLRKSSMIKPVHLLILLAIFIITFIPFRIKLPYQCAICGSPVCGKCAEETEDEFCCLDCLNKLSATKNQDIEGELKESLKRTNQLYKKIISLFLNIILPGAGLIYRNRNFLGLLISFFAVMAYVPIVLKSYFVKPSGWICLSLQPIFIPIMIVILSLCYVISFLVLLRGNYAD